MELVGTINIDFDIFSRSPRHIIVGDASDWIYAKNKPAYISIQLPGSKKKKNFTLKKNQLNWFNSHNLDLSCLSGNCQKEEYIDLPDGIYTVYVQSGYENIKDSKSYLKTDLFELEFDKVLVKYGFEFKREDREFLFHMMETRGVLEVAKANTKLGDLTKAKMFFDEAKDMLNKYSDCKNCL